MKKNNVAFVFIVWPFLLSFEVKIFNEWYTDSAWTRKSQSQNLNRAKVAVNDRSTYPFKEKKTKAK